MALHAEILAGLNDQADHVLAHGAPSTARICRSLISLAKGNSLCGRRIAGWNPVTVLRDAMPLRFAGGLHDLYRRQIEPELGKVYSGEIDDQTQVDALVASVVARHDDALLPWFEGPPQTNEAGRSASFAAALLWLAEEGLSSRWECIEIGSSAGINLMLDRFRFELGDVGIGPMQSDLWIKPEWRGPPPPKLKRFKTWKFASLKGCDVAPINITDPAQLQRLKAYVWPEQPERLARLDFAAYSAGVTKPDLVCADAADFVESELAKSQKTGTTRVLMHSIVWQYLPDEAQRRIQAAMAAAGKAATTEKPLAWISLETNRATFRHELKVSYWPGGSEPVMLGEAHAHGTWINWLADRSAESS